MTVPVFAGATVESGGIFTQIKMGIKELLSSTPEPQPASETVKLSEDTGAQPTAAP
jgi:hypothetical protein